MICCTRMLGPQIHHKLQHSMISFRSIWSRLFVLLGFICIYICICICIYLLLFIHLPGIGRGVWDLRSSALTGDGPLHWKLRDLATGPPGKSLTVHDSKSNFVSSYFSARGKERTQLQESFVCFCLQLWWLWFDFCIHLLVLVPTFMVVRLD